LENDALKVILAPGHSPASLCFYCEQQQFLIGGDVLFRESIGRSDFPGGNLETLLKSIREQLFILPDEVEVFPGHGIKTTIGYEKRNNMFLR
jgi:glyoxylase-like metal-dependent hydrolase (beta-lactamase superfamily II)